MKIKFLEAVPSEEIAKFKKYPEAGPLYAKRRYAVYFRVETTYYAETYATTNDIAMDQAISEYDKKPKDRRIPIQVKKVSENVHRRLESFLVKKL